jgi:excisionase family DNA binding protein
MNQKQTNVSITHTTSAMFIEFPDIITVDQLAEMLSVGKSSAYSLLRSNQIRHVRVGKKYIIPKISVMDFVAGAWYNVGMMMGVGLHTVTKGEEK